MTIVDRMLGKEEPVKIAWEAFRRTREFDVATSPDRWCRSIASDGVIWAMFYAGFVAATELAAAQHENVNAASDEERQTNAPGAGAMGAVIEYRDLIRKALP